MQLLLLILQLSLSSKRFVVLSSVVGTVSMVAEPCANGFGEYDMDACNFCAEHGKNTLVCCDAIYHHSLGHDDDVASTNYCNAIGEFCYVGAGQCYPGLTCVKESDLWLPHGTCQLKADDPNADAAAAALVPSSSSTGTTTMQGVSSFVFVAGAAAMIAMMVVRHRGLLHRHQYSAVEATRIDV